MCTKVLFVFASMLVLLPACQSANPTLQQAETYLEAGRSDTALYLLKSIPQKKLSKSERADYGLLYTWAWDKCDSTIGSHIDSLMQAVAKYYAVHGDRYHRALAAYYQGRVARECHRAPEAQEDFLKALELAKGLNKHVLLCSMNSQIGLLYLYQGNAETAVRYLQQADAEASESNSMGRAYTLQDVARAYSLLQNYDSTLLYYKQALSFISAPASRYILNEIADSYNRIGQSDTALRYVRQAMALMQKCDNPALFYFVAGNIFEKIGKADSATLYFQRAAQTAGKREDTRGGAYHGLAHLALQKGNLVGYARYEEAYDQIRDSVERQVHQANLLKMQSLYDYSQAKKQSAKARLRAKRFEGWLIALGVTLPFAILLTWSFSLRNRYKEEDLQKAQQIMDLQEKNKQLSEENTRRAREEKERALQREPIVIKLRTLDKGLMTNDIYIKVEETVNKYYPNFIRNIAHQEDLTQELLRTVYLSRLNLRTVQIAKLLSIESNSATTRLKKLASIIFEGRLEKDWHSQLVKYLRNLE